MANLCRNWGRKCQQRQRKIEMKTCSFYKNLVLKLNLKQHWDLFEYWWKYVSKLWIPNSMHKLCIKHAKIGKIVSKESLKNTFLKNWKTTIFFKKSFQVKRYLALTRLPNYFLNSLRKWNTLNSNVYICCPECVTCYPSWSP